MLKKLAKMILATTSILTGAALTFASPSHDDDGGFSTVKLKGFTPSEITKVRVNASGTAYEQTGAMELEAK